MHMLHQQVNLSKLVRSDLGVEMRGRLAQYLFSTHMVVSFFSLLVRKPNATLVNRNEFGTE